MSERSGRWIRAALLVAALSAPVAVTAQRPRVAVDRTEMEQRVRARFGDMVRAELGLTQDQRERVDRMVDSFQDEQRALIERQITLRRRFDQASSAARSEDDARSLLREMAAVREEEARLFNAEMDGLLEVLSPSQVLRFYELREDLMDRVRRLRQDGPRRGGPPGPGPRGAPRRGG